MNYYSAKTKYKNVLKSLIQQHVDIYSSQRQLTEIEPATWWSNLKMRTKFKAKLIFVLIFLSLIFMMIVGSIYYYLILPKLINMNQNYT